MRRFFTRDSRNPGVALGVCLGLLLILPRAHAATPAPSAQWVRAWAAAPSFLPATEQVAVENQTLRQTLVLTHAGQALQLRFSNLFGTAPLVIGKVTVAPLDDPSQVHQVTFNGGAGISIPAGTPWLSDVLQMPVSAMQKLQVSIYLPQRTELSTIHWDQRNHTIISGAGDFTEVSAFDAAASTPLRPFLSGIDVLSQAKTKVVVAFGDSITDTDCSIGAELCRWSDLLAARLQAAGKDYAVANEAISGNRVLQDGYGKSALARFDRDVLSVPGVTHVVMLEGINDIGNSALAKYGIGQPVLAAQSLIAAYQQLIAHAHQHGIKIIGCTMTPFAGAGYYSPAKDQVRKAVNDWIRHSRAFDGVIDFEAVARDPAHPDHLLPSFDRGDSLHPNEAGQQAMGRAIDLNLF